MPPHLHPRSRSTVSLFTGTLLASFVVVGMPHIFPCPAPRHALQEGQIYVTSDGQRVMRRRKQKSPEQQLGETEEGTTLRPAGVPSEMADEIANFRQLQAEDKAKTQAGRECPIPKPKGVIGRLLGFEEQNEGSGQGPPPGEFNTTNTGRR